MAWFKDFVEKATEEYKKEMQLERARQQQFAEQQQKREQRDFGYGQAGQSGSPSGWRQQYGQSQSPYQQPQSQQYQGQSSQYQPQSLQYQTPSPQYGQHQSPQYPPPPSPYSPMSAQPNQTPSAQSPDVPYNAAQTDRRTQYYADLAKFQAQAEQAKVDAAKEQAALQAQLQAQMDQAKTHTQQLETQWREAERLAAQYKAEYQAQMKQAEEEMAKMKIEEDRQKSELEWLRAEEARNLKLGEEELVREQQRLFDEIKRQREQQQTGEKEEEEVRPPLPPRVSTEDAARPPLPKRPVSTAGSGSGSGSGSPRRSTPYHYSPRQKESFLSPQSPQSPQSHVPPPPPPPPPPPGPPPTKFTSESQSQRQRQGSGEVPQQQAPCSPPPSSPQTQQTPGAQDQTGQERGSYHSPSSETIRSHKLRNSFHAPSPSSAQSSPRPQPETYTPPPFQSPPKQKSPQQPKPASRKPPRVRTPEPARQHPCGAKPGAECSGALTAFPQDWFYHASVPEFVICARCYVDHIYNTKFCNSFRKVFYNDDEKRRCRFSSRRVKDNIFPAAVESGSLDQLIEFMQKRMTIKDCREQNAVEGELWYRAADIPNGTICQACFEDGLVTSSFAKYYSLQGSQGGAYCDLSVWFLKRKFMDYAKEDRWNEFCRQFNERAQLPDCPKLNVVKANQYTWYKPKFGPEGLQACGACYHDYFLASEDEDKWNLVAGGDFGTRCNLGQLNHVIPMHQAMDDEDRSIFWNAAKEMDKYPFCNSQGTKGGVWYTPINDASWGICAACYEGIVKPVGGSRWFMHDTDVTQDGVYLCGFNFGHPRAFKALEAYVNARNWGESRILLDWAAQWGSVEPCPRIKFSKNRRWWGWGVVAICEDCYASFAKGTALEPRFALTGQREPNKERMCDLFSHRMRSLYNEACTTGNLDAFLAMAEQRHMIYTQTIMQCEQILNEQKIAAMQAQMLGVQGTFYKSMGWSHDVTMGHRYTVGNAYAGYGHENEYVLQGYTYDRQAREKAAEVMSGGPTMRVQMLEARWKEVE